MRITAHVEMHGVPQRLKVFADSLEDWNPAWGDIADDFKDIEKARFASGGGGSWKGHGPLYKEWDDPVTGNSFGSSAILVRSGGLRTSLTTDETILERSAKHMVLGTRYHADSNTGQSVPVAQLMDQGFTARGKISVRTLAGGYNRKRVTGLRVPPRKLIDLSAGDHARWVMLSEKWVVACRKAAGL
jgi:hypothetical protein